MLRRLAAISVSVSISMFLVFVQQGMAQSAADSESSPRQDRLHRETTAADFAHNVLNDQAYMWTAPFRVRPADFDKLIPLGLAAGILVSTDRDTMLHHFQETGKSARWVSGSNYLLATLGGGSAGLYLLGKMRSNNHMAETGLLSVEAATDAVISSEALKVITRRDRPATAVDGSFESGNTSFLNGSFPSEHAVIAWAVAGALSEEYPGFVTKVAAYSGAAAVSYARVAGRQHFPSDVFVGSMLGYWIGHDVVKRRRSEARYDGSFGRFVTESPAKRSIERVFVPMDSWVYPAFDRLAAYGLLRDEASLRPWTRLECSRLIKEASDRMEYISNLPKPVLETFRALLTEFPEDPAAGRLFPVTDIYARGQYIGGVPLTDGYHFGQTISNDYGRADRAGFSTIIGTQISGGWENVGLSFRGEYQHSPLQNISAGTAGLIDQLDRTPGMLGPIFVRSHYPTVNSFTFLDSYLTTEFAGLTLTVGNQTLAWGPSQTSPLLMGENAKPMPMVRLSREESTNLPGLSSVLGPFRAQTFVAQMDGQQNINPFLGLPVTTQPILLGQAFTFQPTENFEFGFTRTGIYGSTGLPITLGGLRNALLSSGNSFGKNDPGDRRSGFFFKYRVPFARDWATFYLDSFTEDEFSPVAYPRKSAIKPGVYFSQLPMLPRLDLRVEASNTDLPSPLPLSSGFFYYNVRYVDGYQNNGFLIGDSIGRQAKQVAASSSIWLQGENKINFGYQDRKVSTDFLPGGGTQSAGFVSIQKTVSERLTMTGFMQVERWLMPALSPSQHWDITSRIELRFKGAK